MLDVAIPADADDRTLTLSLILDAERSKIWRCWTEPKLLEQWFCPRPWRVTDAILDPRSGGRAEMTMRGPDGEVHPLQSVYLEVRPLERIVWTDAFTEAWRPSGKPFMIADMELSDDGPGRTRYVARALHWTLEDKESHEKMGFHEGWRKAAGQLEDLARSL